MDMQPDAEHQRSIARMKDPTAKRAGNQRVNAGFPRRSATKAKAIAGAATIVAIRGVACGTAS